MPVDALGRIVPLPSVPQRVVSLVPSLTEYLFAIGAGGRVVGVTEFCIEPAAQVAHLPKVRGTKNPDREQVAALCPDLVLASKEENRLRDVTLLEQIGIPVYVTDICTVAGALDQLTALASLLEAEAGAAPLLDGIRSALYEQQQQEQRRWRVLAFIWRDPWMAIGCDTYANDLLRLCGAENLALRLEGRYPRAAPEIFLQLEPDVILLPDEPYPFAFADIDVLQLAGAAHTVPAEQIHLCDGKLLTWYGPRTSAALRFFGQFACNAC
jgi:ABC-type Fe3+-hydroxamate transport system substrate-binding protein